MSMAVAGALPATADRSGAGDLGTIFRTAELDGLRLATRGRLVRCVGDCCFNRRSSLRSESMSKAVRWPSTETEFAPVASSSSISLMRLWISE